MGRGRPRHRGRTHTASCADIDPCTPCTCERLSAPTDEGYARIMLRGSTTLKTAVGEEIGLSEDQSYELFGISWMKASSNRVVLIRQGARCLVASAGSSDVKRT